MWLCQLIPLALRLEDGDGLTAMWMIVCERQWKTSPSAVVGLAALLAGLKGWSSVNAYLSAETLVLASRSISLRSAFSCFFWTFSARRISRSILASMSEAPTTTSPA